MQSYLDIISRGNTLNLNQAHDAMLLICSEASNTTQIAAFLSILHTRGETLDELLGFITYMRNQMKIIQCDNPFVIDMCGTGGDYSNTFNISTACALLLASQGVSVAKHGGRSVSSLCGSADVLEALGFQTALSMEQAEKMLAEHHFTFLFAPDYNPAFQQVKSLRKLLGIRTCFNLIGPLLNPARVKRQVIGVYSKHLLDILPPLLLQLGSEEVMIVHAQDGLDEFSLNAPTDVAHLKAGEIRHYTVRADELGLSSAPLSAIKGGDSAMNAEIIRRVFGGERGAYRDSVVLNAAAGFVVSGRTGTLKEGVELANKAIDSGEALEYLRKGKNTFLQTMRVITEKRVNNTIHSLPHLRANLSNTRTPHSFTDVFLIAEIKFASPSLGKIHAAHDPLTIAEQYLANGASALSVLTEPTYFQGDLSYLQIIRHAFPEARLLMKDFILSEQQLLQARTYGADAVLLIVAFLSQDELHHLYHFAIQIGLTPLVEVHTLYELQIAEALGAKLIGINNRDLKTLKIDLNTSIELIKRATSNAIFISESGIKTAEDMMKLQQHGFHGFLIGSHFMQDDNPGLSLKKFLSEVSDAG